MQKAENGQWIKRGSTCGYLVIIILLLIAVVWLATRKIRSTSSIEGAIALAAEKDSSLDRAEVYSRCSRACTGLPGSFTFPRPDFMNLKTSTDENHLVQRPPYLPNCSFPAPTTRPLNEDPNFATSTPTNLEISHSTFSRRISAPALGPSTYIQGQIWQAADSNGRTRWQRRQWTIGGG